MTEQERLEQEWLESNYPGKMLYLQFNASDRKLRLFACACCRRIWHLMTDERSRHAVDVAERFADGLVTDEDRASAEQLALNSWEDARRGAQDFDVPFSQGDNGEIHWAEGYHDMLFRLAAPYPAFYASRDFKKIHPREQRPRAVSDTLWASSFASKTVLYSKCGEVMTEYPPPWSEEECLRQAILLRDIFGNPFQPVPHVSPAILHWNNGIIPKLAEAIYQGGAFNRLPNLADALEKAGGVADKVLAHCRHPGPHVRGCWVIDLLLGKE
jgi:hypothetical protein